MSDWQPIETAPEDEMVLLATTGEWIGTAWWVEEEPGEKVWRWFGGDKLHLNHKPLGWMALPDPPPAPQPEKTQP